MTDPQLPAVSEGFDLGFPVAPPSMDGPTPILRVDHGSGEWSQKPGSWNFMGLPLEQIHVVIMAAREFRELYAADYKDDPDAPLVCCSWDGVHAYGKGCRDAGAEITDQTCAEVLPGGRRKITCPTGKGSKAEWLCRPSFDYFMLLQHGDDWVPAFFKATGILVKEASRIWQGVSLRAQASKGENPPYFWLLSPKLFKQQGKLNYLIEWGTPKLIEPGPDRDRILEFVKSGASEMWKEHIMDHHEKAMKIGVTDDDAGEEQFKPGDAVPF